VAGESPDKAPSATASERLPTPPSSPRSGGNHRCRRIFLVAAIVAVGMVVLLAYALTGGFQSSHNGPLVLVPAGAYYTIPVGQFNAITFIVGTTSVINGTFSNAFGIVLYEMNNTQFLSYGKTNILDGYEWTSGPVAANSVYDLDLTIPPGSWALVFSNPSPINVTAIGFYTDLTLASG